VGLLLPWLDGWACFMVSLGGTAQTRVGALPLLGVCTSGFARAFCHGGASAFDGALFFLFFFWGGGG